MNNIRNITGEILAVIGIIIGMIGNWYENPIAILGLIIAVIGLAIIVFDIAMDLRSRHSC